MAYAIVIGAALIALAILYSSEEGRMLIRRAIDAVREALVAIGLYLLAFILVCVIIGAILYYRGAL